MLSVKWFQYVWSGTVSQFVCGHHKWTGRLRDTLVTLTPIVQHTGNIVHLLTPACNQTHMITEVYWIPMSINKASISMYQYHTESHDAFVSLLPDPSPTKFLLRAMKIFIHHQGPSLNHSVHIARVSGGCSTNIEEPKYTKWILEVKMFGGWVLLGTNCHVYGTYSWSLGLWGYFNIRLASGTWMEKQLNSGHDRSEVPDLRCMSRHLNPASLGLEPWRQCTGFGKYPPSHVFKFSLRLFLVDICQKHYSECSGSCFKWNPSNNASQEQNNMDGRLNWILQTCISGIRLCN